MTVEQLKQLFLSRQSCRNFSDKPVSDAQIKEICSLAALAPSACNLQPWKIYAVKGEKLPAVKALLKAHGKAPFADNIPVLLAVAEDSRASKETNPALSYFAPGDVGELTAYLILAAESAGLSSCILGWRNGDGLKELLGIPDGLTIPWLVAIGYAREDYETRPKTRKPLDEILTFCD